ncbi:hypothetical protein DPM19_15120 [Actinomadura craniellae]|uniref:Uncharacterized protein n=1 Tax=Actinomadura craniellae TaxID=2231787 RepID=A0A365H7R6_9ACTN|nr:hypothetical protein [Actinomadura craniellae]RAY14303.1 hypothetical protein DPM19_15120 [Actinomadura craniellae]
MRVYLPSTLPALARALATGSVEPGTAYAVTPALREWYADGDLEELEYAALTAAARASLRLLAADPAAPPRRVVLVAEVPEGTVSGRGEPGPDPARVGVAEPVPAGKIVAGHVDDEDAADDVRAAAEALPAADAGDDDARFTVDGAEGHELMWYATQELPHLG